MKFISVFFLTSALLVALLLGFVYSIDPYDKYQINVFGFETKAVALARENKFNMLEHSKTGYEAFVIGSSAAHRLHTADVEELTGLRTFNYAVQQTTPEDYLAITKHIFSKRKPKLVLLQLDLYALNSNFKTDTRFYTSPLYKFLSEESRPTAETPLIDPDYVSVGAISDAFKVIWVNATGTVKHLYLEDGNYHKEKQEPNPIKVTQFAYENYQLSQERLALLRKLRALCDENGTRLVAWTAPYSSEHYHRIEADPKVRKVLEDFKASLARIFPELYDFTNAGVDAYDDTEYFQDSTHPTRKLFRIMLEDLFGATAKNPVWARRL